MINSNMPCFSFQRLADPFEVMVELEKRKNLICNLTFIHPDTKQTKCKQLF